jgi:hypothetical protein
MGFPTSFFSPKGPWDILYEHFKGARCSVHPPKALPIVIVANLVLESPKP